MSYLVHSDMASWLISLLGAVSQLLHVNLLVKGNWLVIPVKKDLIGCASKALESRAIKQLCWLIHDFWSNKIQRASHFLLVMKSTSMVLLVLYIVNLSKLQCVFHFSLFSFTSLKFACEFMLSVLQIYQRKSLSTAHLLDF